MRTFSIVTKHGDFDPPAELDDEKPEASIVAISETGERLEFNITTWEEASELKDATTLQVSITPA